MRTPYRELTEEGKKRQRAAVHKWQKANPEKRLAMVRSWRKANSERVRKNKRENYLKNKANPEWVEAQKRKKYDPVKRREYMSEYGPKYYQSHKVRILRRMAYAADRRKETNHGLGVDQFLDMLRDQSGKCFLCGDYPKGTSNGTKSLHIDHDHQTGAIRKLLCSRCNLILGQAGEDTMLLEKMIDYIRKFRTQ